MSLLILLSVSLIDVPAQAADTSSKNVLVNVPWSLINQCGHQAVSGPCQAYCWAYCRIILDQKAHTYRDYYVDGAGGATPSTVGYNDGKGAASTSELFKIIYDNVNAGKPVMLRVLGSKKADGTYYNHFVVAIGYKATNNPNSLKQSDILILNPTNKEIKQGAGSSETYTYLSSCTLNENRYWAAKSGGTSVTTSNSESTSKKTATYDDCNVQVACVNGQTVNLYNNPGDTSRVTYFNRGQVAYSTYLAKLSDGTTWYRVGAVYNGSDRMFWLKYESSKMKVTTISSAYTVTLDPAGGSVSTSSIKVTKGSTYGSLPTPTKNGYTFDGWYTARSGGSKITGSSNVNLTVSASDKM